MPHRYTPREAVRQRGLKKAQAHSIKVRGEKKRKRIDPVRPLHPEGSRAAEIARRLGVPVKTIYRDSVLGLKGFCNATPPRER